MNMFEFTTVSSNEVPLVSREAAAASLDYCMRDLGLEAAVEVAWFRVRHSHESRARLRAIAEGRVARRVYQSDATGFAGRLEFREGACPRIVLNADAAPRDVARTACHEVFHLSQSLTDPLFDHYCAPGMDRLEADAVAYANRASAELAALHAPDSKNAELKSWTVAGAMRVW